MSKWGGRISFGPYIDFQEWNIWHRYFVIGFGFIFWDFGLEIILWDIEKSVQMLKKDYGLTEEQGWDFADGVRKALPDPYDSKVNMRKEIEKALPKLSCLRL